MLRSLILLLFVAPAVHAAPLSWEECVQRLSRDNPELQAQVATLEAAKFRESGSYNGFLPHLSANVAYNQSGTDPARPTPSSEGYTAGVSLTQSLFTGFSDVGLVRRSEANTQIAESDLKAVRARLSKELKTAFENVLYAKRLIELQGQIVQRRADNQRLVSLRFQGGRENRGSLLWAEAVHSESKLEQLQARLALRTAKADLGKLLGMDDIAEIDVTGNVPVTEPGGEITSLNTLVAQTPEVVKSQAEEEGAKADLTISRSAFFPTLTLSGNVGTSERYFFPNENRTWSTSISLNFPFFDSGRDYYATRATSQAYLAAIHRRTKAQQTKLFEMESAYGNYLQAVERVKVNTAMQEGLSVRAEVGRAKYNNGMLSFEDWDTLETDLIKRQRATLEGRRDRVVAEALWEQVQGLSVLP